jgi:hypothetical protein
MRRPQVLAAVLSAIALCSIAAYGDRPRITKAMMTAYERQFAGGIISASKEPPSFTIIDPPRAFYLDNFGIMMTSEISLVPGITLTMFRVVDKEDIQVHRRKVMERLPVLREQMKLALFDGATRFDTLDERDRLAVAVTVYHFAWEDTTEIPSQIVMQGTKKALLEARAKTQEQGRDQALQMKEMY